MVKRLSQPKVISIKMWSSFAIYIILLVMISVGVSYAGAQMLPLPVPELKIQDSFEGEIGERELQFPKVFQPPIIEVMTDPLTEGKNVFRINITSEAPIEDCKITFKKDEIKKTEDCVKDTGSVFKALIDAKQPYQTVKVDARDLYGDSSTMVKKLQVLPKPSIEDALGSSWNHLLDSTRNMLNNVMMILFFLDTHV
jgi:hypothetical protein